MTAPAHRWRWSDDSGWNAAPAADRVGVVDSWLVADGRTVALDVHADRFTASCEALFAMPPERTRAFLRAAIARIPEAGCWFPRVELTTGERAPEFHLWLRPAPERAAAVRMWRYPHPDQRRYPAVKGPDLDWLAGVRAAAAEAGADEALLVTADGRIGEGTTTSLLWWRGDVLCTPGPQRAELLPGVTRKTLLRMAATAGVRVAYERPRPADLDGLETWAVNALHGIRPVRAWIGAAVEPGPARRAAEWQARLDARSSEIHLETTTW